MTVSDSVIATAGRRTYVRLGITLAVFLAAGGMLAAHRATLDSGTDQLAAADREWLVLACCATLATWVCAAVAQQGAVVERLPKGRLVAAQFAACAANHILPAGAGASLVNLRFLTRCGLSTRRSATALAVKAAVGGIVRCVLGVVLLVAAPGAVPLSARVPHMLFLVPVVAATVVSAVMASGRIRRALGRAVTDVREVHRSRGRACALWGGSVAFALLHAGVVVAVVRALGLALPTSHVVMAYLVASGAAALLPTPGGLGSLDAALAFALTAAGAPGQTAISAVIGYRLLTGWLPMAPGLLILGLLARRSAL
ncbi:MULTISPECIES: lysylphosphatidylglycerol synthase transmembrane domain-containing protein [Streptomyces]|uniref:lysylphosphatidylglycerol synthase transmembrane domain-containing protein n=1 Tax=Streptomyces TaxID=1883 RepID=UPI0029AE414E|nr:YbhN family protein [Streptomyces stelliscabiei]MDX2661080.1 YbhN family protein [Streptomyces stelliscabiei]MDX2715947.1 YbhN family protein [Streptomyces stelliscabiei]MDX2790057.1 YbhN family protein [Streptomyces stelliscabiei]